MKLNFVLFSMFISKPVTCSLISNINDAIYQEIIERYYIKNSTTYSSLLYIVEEVLDQCNIGDISSRTEALFKVCQDRDNVSSCQDEVLNHCIDTGGLLGWAAKQGIPLTVDDVTPSLLHNIISDRCRIASEAEHHHLSHEKPPSWKAWLYGSLFVLTICVISNVGGLMAPCMKRRFIQKIQLVFVALAAGTLVTTGCLVLIPEALGLTGPDSPVPDYQYKLATVMAGIYFFYISEKLMKIWFKRRSKRKIRSYKDDIKADLSSHEVLNMEIDTKREKKCDADPTKLEDGRDKSERRTVAFMVMTGDALHNFVDGISMGAAFTESVYLGISVSLAILCEELPHELGDIAILLQTGLSMKRALCYNFLAALACAVGLIIGILLGENTDANSWIFAIAGGMFVYIALIDLVPEMDGHAKYLEENNIETCAIILLLQNIGLLVGFGIILIISVYGGNIRV